MFERFGNNQPDDIDRLIIALTAEMGGEVPGSEKYKDLLSTLERLHKLKGKTPRQPISRDAMVAVAGNLLGILIIVAYEQKHVMTSKSFGWLKPIRHDGGT